MAKNVTRKTVTKRNRKNIEGSYEAGSVASISYLQDGIEKTLKEEQHTFIQALTIQ
jgi:hypothetical protein